jgi:lysophospholipase L1-like esterase
MLRSIGFFDKSSVTVQGPLISTTGDSKGNGVGTPMVQVLQIRDDVYWNYESKSISGKDVAYFDANIVAITATLSASAKYITINLGANDFAGGAIVAGNQAAWTAKYQNIIDHFHTQCPNAKIGVMRAWSRTYDAEAVLLAAWLVDVVAGRSWAYIGPDEAVILKAGDDGATYTLDGIHPTTAGYALEAAEWITVLGM